MRLPHIVDPRWPEIRPGRFAERVRTDSPDGCAVAILGLPDDLGVRLNRGRPGASRGPAAFRAALAQAGCPFDAVDRNDLSVEVFDAGDVEPARGDDEAALHETHDRITEAAMALHRAGLIVIGIGGGHDLTFASVRGLSSVAGAAASGINIDPHLDVREQPGSGMPFRALIEGDHLDPARFHVLGVGPFANSREHVEYLTERGASITTIDEVRSGGDGLRFAFDSVFGRERDAGFVSVDLDSVDGAFAPGVSAVNPCGLTPREIVEIARLAGRCPSVRHFDIMELCPAHDDPPWNDSSPIAGRTARLASLILLTFIAGVRSRMR